MSTRAHALGGRARTPVEAVRRVAGIYGAAPTCHFSLVVRVRDYAPSQLDDAILRTRELVRVPAMRGSIYLMPRDLVPHALAITPTKGVVHITTASGITPAQYARLADRIETAVAGKPLVAADIRAALGRHAPDGAALTAVLRRMTHEGRIVRAAVRGGVRSQSFEYARMAEWIDLPQERPSREYALRELARLWLRANGPATAEDLPMWDAFLMSHRDRSRYLDPKHAPYVVDRGGNTTNVILEKGRVAGIWDIDGATLLYATFRRVAKLRIAAAAKRLAPVHAFDEVREVEHPKPLDRQNDFQAPLRRRA